MLNTAVAIKRGGYSGHILFTLKFNPFKTVDNFFVRKDVFLGGDHDAMI